MLSRNDVNIENICSNNDEDVDKDALKEKFLSSSQEIAKAEKDKA